MKELTCKYKFVGTTAWGVLSSTTRQVFLIEKCDVGKEYENYLGYRHRTYKFVSSDVGRMIEHILHREPSWCFVREDWVLDALNRYLNATADHTNKACTEVSIEKFKEKL